MHDEKVWSGVDDLLFQGDFISALAAYRAMSGAGLPDAMDAVGARAAHLRATQPGRFAQRPAPSVVARKNLQGVPGRICVIEAVWDGDTVHDWFVVLVAISAQGSATHPRYTESYLCHITHSDVDHGSLVEAAEALQRRLAAETGAEVKAPVWPPDDRASRWWNDPAMHTLTDPN
jgi:hypothetical protein